MDAPKDICLWPKSSNGSVYIPYVISSKYSKRFFIHPCSRETLVKELLWQLFGNAVCFIENYEF